MINQQAVAGFFKHTFEIIDSESSTVFPGSAPFLAVVIVTGVFIVH